MMFALKILIKLIISLHSLTMVMQTVQVIVSLAASIPAKPVSISISILWCNARNILHHELLETNKQKNPTVLNLSLRYKLFKDKENVSD